MDHREGPQQRGGAYGGEFRMASSGEGRRKSSVAHSVARIIREYKEITAEPNPFWHASPLSFEEPYEWHFTLRGPADSDFSGGLYHGRIILPDNYPYSPPSIVLMTPNGRFDVGKKVCLSASNYHPELWQPAWGLRTMLDALTAFFPTPGEGALHSLDWPAELRKRLALESTCWKCNICQKRNKELVEEHCSPPTSDLHCVHNFKDNPLVDFKTKEKGALHEYFALNQQLTPTDDTIRNTKAASFSPEKNLGGEPIGEITLSTSSCKIPRASATPRSSVSTSAEIRSRPSEACPEVLGSKIWTTNESQAENFHDVSCDPQPLARDQLLRQVCDGDAAERTLDKMDRRRNFNPDANSSHNVALRCRRPIMSESQSPVGIEFFSIPRTNTGYILFSTELVLFLLLCFLIYLLIEAMMKTLQGFISYS